MLTTTYNYQETLAASVKANWRVEDIIGGEKRIDFTKQIKPIFKNQCYDCHTTNHAKGGLDMSTKAGLTKGGDTGKLFKAGKSAQSLLIKRLKGQGGPRMPKGEDALKESQVKLISKWIDEGARM